MQVVNLGVQAYGSDQSLIALKKFISSFNTKMVVYTFIDEHVRRNNRQPPLFKLEGNKLVQLPYKSGKPLRVIEFLQNRLGLKYGWFPSDSKALTRRMVQEMKAVSTAHGAKFVMIDWRWEKDDSLDLFKGLNIDILDSLSSSPQGWEKMRNSWDGHPTPEANTHIAWLLLKYLEDHGLRS